MQTRWAQRRNDLSSNVTIRAKELNPRETVFTPAYRSAPALAVALVLASTRTRALFVSYANPYSLSHPDLFPRNGRTISSIAGYDGESVGDYFNGDTTVTEGLSGVSANLYCYAWQSYMNGDMLRAVAEYIPTTLTYALQLQALDLVPTYYTCTDEAAVGSLVSALIYASSDTRVTCDGEDWFVQACDISDGGGTSLKTSALCVGADTCAGLNLCSARSLFNTGLFLSPCSTDDFLPVSSAVAFLVAGFKEFAPAPTVHDMTVTPFKAGGGGIPALEVNITTGHGEAGLLMCRAIETLAMVPGSVAKITASQLVSTISVGGGGGDGVNGTASLTIGNLDAATTYDVYCLTQSLEGVMGTLETALDGRVTTTTQCCKDINIVLTTSEYIEGTVVANALTVDVGSRPIRQVTLTITATDSDGVDHTFFVPRQLELDSTSAGTALSRSFTFMSPDDSWNRRPYNLSVTISGHSAFQYSLSHTGDMSFRINPFDQPLPPPSQLAARFSNSLTQVYITFDVPTDRAGLVGAFACSDLFQFWMASSSECSWNGASVVSVTPGKQAGQSMIILGDAVVLAPAAGVVLKAECSAKNGDCSAWAGISANTENSALVAAVAMSLVPLVPTVSIAGPSSVGSCDSATLLLGGEGGGGRDWYMGKLSVRITGASINATLRREMDEHLDGAALDATRVSVPGALLQSGHRYSFTAIKCNFMMQCGVRSHTTSVLEVASLPVVEVIGTTTRQVLLSEEVAIESTAYFPACDGSMSVKGLKAQWSVTDSVTGLPLEYTNPSPNPFKFKMDARLLEVGGDYVVNVLVYKVGSVYSASADVAIQVVQGPLVAGIGGSGVLQLASLGTDSVGTLDASTLSFNSDFPGISAIDAGLSFEWSCFQSAPTYSETCDGISYRSIGRARAVIEITWVAPDSVSAFQVTVSDATRSATANYEVVTLKDDAPLVRLEGDIPTSYGHYNPLDVLVIRGQADVAEESVTEWSVEPAINDIQATTTGATSTWHATPLVTAAMSTGLLARYLVVSAGAMSPRETYTFTLKCSYPGFEPIPITTTKVLVTTNGPPVPGVLRSVGDVTEGTELATMFTFEAAYWSDTEDNIPLQYEFGMVNTASLSEDRTMLAQRSDSPRSDMRMAQGVPAAEYQRIMYCYIFDKLDARAISFITVTVRPMLLHSDGRHLASVEVNGAAVEERMDAMEDILDSEDIEDMSTASPMEVANRLSLLRSVTSALNVPKVTNCTHAPNCTELHRAACGALGHTCGLCLEGFLGVAAESNLACLTEADLRTTAPETQECFCSGDQGVCHFASDNTGLVIPALDGCFVGDACSPVCVCADGFAGSTCAQTNSSLAKARGEITVHPLHRICTLHLGSQPFCLIPPPTHRDYISTYTILDVSFPPL